MNEAPERIWVHELSAKELNVPLKEYHIEYIRTDAFIEKACKWIKENITNNPNANSVLVRNGCVTLGMLIENFKNYMKGE